MEDLAISVKQPVMTFGDMKYLMHPLQPLQVEDGQTPEIIGSNYKKIHHTDLVKDGKLLLFPIKEKKMNSMIKKKTTFTYLEA